MGIHQLYCYPSRLVFLKLMPAVPAAPDVPAVLPVLQALDYVLHSAARHGVRLILVLGGSEGGGTPATYMQWVRGGLNLTGG